MTERPFVYDALAGRVVFGPGRIADVPAEVGLLGAKRVLLISGRAEAGTGERLAASLGGLHAVRIVGVRQHVPLETAAEARRIAAEAGADCLLALGGGSAIGLAKAVALEQRLPIVAVPTTYSGSEMTPIWGLTEGDRKTTGRDLAVLPRTVVYDPELTLSLPAAVSGPSGLNALAHCVEALWAAGANPLTSAVAGEGIRLLAGALPGIAADPRDLTSRSAALRGAWLAGSALAAAGTALHHKLCHVLGGLGLPHAETHSVVLPYVTAFNAAAAPEAVALVARALGVEDAAQGLYELRARLGVAASLEALGLDEPGLDLAADLAAAVAPPEPRLATRGDIRELLEHAYRGDPP